MYTLKQFRSDTQTHYMDNLAFIVQEKDTQSDFSEAVVFKDQQLITDQWMTTDKNYCINFQIPQGKQDLTVLVYLTETGDKIQPSKTQRLGLFTVPHTETTSVLIPFEIAFNPLQSFNTIVFEIQREKIDFEIYNPEEKYYGRKLDLKIQFFTQFVNLVTDIFKIPAIKRLGIQGPPGLKMCLNGEEIHIGKTGIYELFYDMDVFSLGVAVRDESQSFTEKQPYFTIDYQY